jgi:Transglycosylase SLT domain/Peptidase family M23
MPERRHRKPVNGKPLQPARDRYAPSAWAVLRTAALGGTVAFFVGASPAGSLDGEPAPNIVVTPDCPTTPGFLPDGRPCVIGPAAGDPAPPAPPSSAQEDPPPAATPPPETKPGDPPPAPPPPAPAPVKQKGKREERKVVARDDTPSTPTRVGPKRTERSEPDPERRTRKPKRRRPKPAADPGPASTGSAGLPALSFNPPSAARPVPDVLLDRFPIPPFLLPIYQAAAVEYEVPWQVLAAINEIETDYGRNLNVSSAGAMGWMQFIPSSWKAYGVDANDDGRKDPYNPVDAIFAAGRYLKAAGAKDDLRRAIFAYNHADWYVDSVMLRAKLIRALPEDLVGALTGITQGRFPVTGRTSYPKQAGPEGITLDARDGASVIAVNDGVVKRIGQSKKLGQYLVLQDVYGNRYTYAHLGEVSRRYAAPKTPGPEDLRDVEAEHADGHAEEHDPRPTGPASAGSQPRRPAAGEPRKVLVRVAKERLFAHPSRPAAYEAGGRHQIEQYAEPLPEDASLSQYFVADFPIKREDLVLRTLREGAQVVGGTVLGRTAKRRLRFRVRPAGKGAPAVDPRPILDGWRLLEDTEVYRGKAFRTMGVRNPSIGQLMLMSKEGLVRRVLADKRIDIYECGRRDVATGIVDRRVLITLAYLAASNLKPRVSALQCGHSYYTSGGSVSWHSSGNAADIASINGTPILGHQGKGSITDVTIRRLLTLQGTMRPGQIISLMTYAGHPNTMSMSDHADHIHVGFQPRNAGLTTAAGGSAQILKPKQWTRLVKRLGRIDNPRLKGAAN